MHTRNALTFHVLWRCVMCNQELVRIPFNAIRVHQTDDWKERQVISIGPIIGPTNLNKAHRNNNNFWITKHGRTGR